nr:hypothetical protein [Maliibacterium massiliense]
MRTIQRVFHKDDPKAHYELCDLPNCAFLTCQGTCSKLDVSACIGDACAFIQSEGDISRARAQWKARMQALDTQQQCAIAKKYYRGQMPWQDGNTNQQGAKGQR